MPEPTTTPAQRIAAQFRDAADEAAACLPSSDTDTKAATFRLAERLGTRGYGVAEGQSDLTVTNTDNGRSVEVQARRRRDDGNRVWFCWKGGIWICEADQVMNAVTAIKGALRRFPDKK
ncbi:hypothetical protein [Thermomonospora umbrina]|uniref:Uncharacterized protein n=1 Tax=Thermomonospora umbrina TaxID=111806 RepID=A0A3D9SXL6_9ACTN|nr:hypothetical protein [Thermomonospora umbrina]REF00700.1 hypothetical protein DFJ69_6264 [Thermomonospora umbrina]